MSQPRPVGRAVPSWFTSRPAVVGHRGAAAQAPENTLASFRAAIGADAVETDVQLSDDDVPFLLHDDSLDRTTDAAARGLDAAAPASTLPWEELRVLDAGAWASAGSAGSAGSALDGPDGEPGRDAAPGSREQGPAAASFAGERLPRLDELADLLTAALDAGRRLGLDLEVKTPSVHSPASVVAALGAALASPRWERLLEAEAVLLTSFDPEIVQLACEQLPIPVGLLTASTPPAEEIAALAEAGLAAIVTSHEDLTAPVVAAAHQAGLLVGVYTANDPDDWDRLRALDVDAIVTDDPHALLRHLGRAVER